MEGDNINTIKQNDTKIEINLENNNTIENIEHKKPQEYSSTKIRIGRDLEPDEKNNNIDNEEKKEEEKKEEEKKEEEEKEEEKYDLNKDYNFLSILQFVNLFHKVLGLNPISSTELEFSLLHTDIDPLCCNVLSKLLQKKEQHRPTKQNKDKEKEKEKDGNFTESNNNLIEKSSTNNLLQKDKEINNTIFTQDNLLQLNEELLKKLNYFYKIYIRYLKKIYNVSDSSKLIEIIKTDSKDYLNSKYENDFYSFTKYNLSSKYYADCDIKTELIVKLFRDLNGEHPLRNINNPQELEILMSNKDNEKNNTQNNNYQSTTEIIDINNTSIISEENNNNTKTFEALNIKQKVILLMFFCNYCMSFSGRQPLYLEEIMTNTEDNFINNKKILPLFFDKEGFNNYIFPLNKDCRIYKEKIKSWEVSKSIKESFDIKIKNYTELEKLLEEEKDQNIIKKLKDKLLEFKANDEEEQKKINSNNKKEEIYLKAKKLREMNKNCNEIQKYKNTDYLLMNMSNHMMTRRQLNQITQLSQVSTRNKYNSLIFKEKPKELTEEEKHKLKIEKEKLEREKRMEKRNRIIEKMQKEEEYKLNHPEEAQKLLNNKKKREKEKKKKKRHNTWSEEESEYDENEYEEELLENYDNSDSEKKTKKKKTNLKNIILSDDDDDIGENMYQPKRKKISNNPDINTTNIINEQSSPSSEIINDGNLIYRYSSNQIELDGNWYVANDPSYKERISYLFSGSQMTKEIKLNIENTETIINMCSENLVECIQLDILFKNCLEFLNGAYSGYFMYYSKTIEENFEINLDIQDSLVKIEGKGKNSLGDFTLNGYFNFFRNKDIIKEKNNIEDQVIKIAEFKINKNYTMFNPTENEKVIKSYNHRRKKNDNQEEDE